MKMTFKIKKARLVMCKHDDSGNFERSSDCPSRRCYEEIKACYERAMWLLRRGALAATFAALAVVGPSCSDETAGRRVTLATTVTVDATTFTNAGGWDVKVDRALLSIGRLYYFDGEPVLARRRAFGLGAAHAHPGHYAPGAAVGQVLGGATVDLAAGNASLSPGTGVTGTLRSARLVFGVPPAGPLAAGLAGKVVRVEGKATRAGVTRSFVATASADDLKDASGAEQVEGCAFAVAAVDGDGTITLRVALRTWLDQVDFDKAPGDPATLDGTEAGNAFLRGVQKAAAYRLSFERRVVP